MTYLTDEERKEDCTYTTNDNCFKFSFKRDLSGGVKVRAIYLEEELPRNKVAQAVAEFMLYWMLNTYEKLNGFAGIDCVKWDVHSVIKDGKLEL